MGDSAFSQAVLLLADSLGGALNAIAGGGSFLTLPALVYAGLDELSGNATGTVVLLPLAGAASASVQSASLESGWARLCAHLMPLIAIGAE